MGYTPKQIPSWVGSGGPTIKVVPISQAGGQPKRAQAGSAQADAGTGSQRQALVPDTPPPEASQGGGASLAVLASGARQRQAVPGTGQALPGTGQALPDLPVDLPLKLRQEANTA